MKVQGPSSLIRMGVAAQEAVAVQEAMAVHEAMAAAHRKWTSSRH
jgi:hypothetical protein